MKNSSYRSFLFLLLTAVSFKLTANTISGTIYYSGSASEQIAVAVFTDPTLEGEPLKFAQIEAPGSYSITELSDGTYYVVSIMGISSEGEIESTDPWGAYGTLEALTPVVISGGAGVSGVDITLVGGTQEHPNPFANAYLSPAQIIQLPVTTEGGENPSIVTDGVSIYLNKHDYDEAPSGKIYKIDPSSGEVTDTYNINLESLPNGTSWIDQLIYHNGVLWALGGYGDPSGSGGVPGVFRFDISSSLSSNQLPAADTTILFANDFASDGVNLYASVAVENGNGIVKFNPEGVSAVPSSLFMNPDAPIRSLCFGGGYLWAGINQIRKIDPANGNILEDFNFPPSAAGLYFNDKLWSYDEVENTLEVYNLEAVGVENEKDNKFPSKFSLSQNYPNPFNPSTVISYRILKEGMVTLKIYDVLGREVMALADEYKSAGSYTVKFDASELAGGVYIYRIQAGAFNASKKMLLIK
ncbi:MAG TPA: T9SS type A sorting domain-containing protein [Ignavibacteriaceae bacterium]|nr:T9SS type A sorting domain-containing protein [Ignavibacteriaceae bacterium]